MTVSDEVMKQRERARAAFWSRLGLRDDDAAIRRALDAALKVARHQTEEGGTVTEDARLTLAKAWLAPCPVHGALGVCVIGEPCPRPKNTPIPAMLQGVVDFAEERLRVNVGLGMENKELRRRIHELEEGPQQEVYG